MYERPDYATARARTRFSWDVSGTYLAFHTLADVPIREFFLKPEACIEAYRTGRPKVRELFGEDVKLPHPATPPISYGHANGLGCGLLFPEGGEVGVEHRFSRSLDEAIAALRKPVDFARAGMAPFYLKFRETMQKAFPDEPVGFSHGSEGPVTTAYELRGDPFFLDPIDEPDKTREFLGLLTKSILDFHAFRCALTGAKPVSPDGTGLCDDIASMVPPRLWEKCVLPFWEQYYTGKTTGTRSAHVEDLKPAQLKYLEDIGLSFYDPSISPHLNPRVIFESCRIPFLWRLGSFHYYTMTGQDVDDFVFQAVADGASSVVTYIEGTMCTEQTAAKVKAFIRAAKQVESLIAEGCSRAELALHVSESGKRKFWDNWLH
jgi:hypothetical protein